MCGEGGEEPSMPLARYFLWVGAVLLALLLVADLSLPELPIAKSADARLPAIHIRSCRNCRSALFTTPALQRSFPPRSRTARRISPPWRRTPTSRPPRGRHLRS